MNKKGFTLVELLAVIVILAVVITVAVPAFNKYILQSEKQYYNSLEKSVKTSGMEYFNENSVFFPKEVGEYAVVNKDELKGSGIIENITDSEGNPCQEVNVIVQKKENGSYEYMTCLKCGDYQTNTPICRDGLQGDGSGKTGPTYADIQIIKKTTNSITVEAICKDEKSSIIGYQYKINNGDYTELTGDKTYKFDNLKDGEDYTFQIKCYNANNKSRESKVINAVTASFGNPTMEQIQTSEGYPLAGFDYSPKRDIKIIYNSYNIEQEDAEYFFKSDIDISVNVDVYECNITYPNESENKKVEYETTCSGTPTKTITADKWYKTNDLETVTTFATDTYDEENNTEIVYTLYAQTGDKVNLSGISSYGVSKVDTKEPTITAIAKPKTLGNEDYNFVDNVEYTFGYSSGDVVCDPSSSKKTGVYNVTCTATGKNGLTATTDFEAKHSYPATYIKKECPYDCNCKYVKVCTAGYEPCDPYECDWAQGWSSSCTQHFNSTCCKAREVKVRKCKKCSKDCSYYECQTADGKVDKEVQLKGNTCYY